MSVQVNNFKWEKGKNDLKYIELLEKTLETQKRITNEAVAKIKTLAAENAKLKKDLKNKKNKIAVNKERLTAKNETDTAYYFPLCFEKCDGLGASRKCDTCDLIYNICEKLGEYEELEEQGLLLRLPCERVWFICDCGTKYATVMSKSIYDLELYQIKEIDVKGYYFSTQSEAEEKLRELEE